MLAGAWTATAGTFWRSIFASDIDRIFEGAKSPEGRYHHSGQKALYLSPSPEFSRIAIDTYLRPGDAPRFIVPLDLTAASLADLLDPTVQRNLGLNGRESGTPWQPQRALGLPATAWIASDAARHAGADGIFYAARSDPARWHIVLFRWNQTDGPQIRQIRPPIPFFKD